LAKSVDIKFQLAKLFNELLVHKKPRNHMLLAYCRANSANAGRILPASEREQEDVEREKETPVSVADVMEQHENRL
jgi:hypothetical protein